MCSSPWMSTTTMIPRRRWVRANTHEQPSFVSKSPFENHKPFAKTGSRQPRAKLKQRDRFCRQGALPAAEARRWYDVMRGAKHLIFCDAI
jgi:hypothetical protein